MANGKLYCVEEARTERQYDECAVGLEDNVYQREQDRIEALALLDRALRRIEISRNPCGFFRRIFSRDECEVD